MKNILRSLFVAAIVVSVSVIYSCGQGSQSKTESDSITINKEQVQSNVAQMVKTIPSPYELSLKLEEIGSSYIEGSVNSINNIDKYFTEKNKALNLGIYGADLAYVSTYEKKQEVSLYTKAVKTLVDQLGIKIDLAKLSSEETKEKLDNKDSLANIVSATFLDVYNFLNENSDPSLAALVAAGVWVEGLYLAMQISEETFNNNDFVKIIYDQQNSLSKVIELLDMFKNDQLINSMVDALKKLQIQFESTNGSLTVEQLNGIGQTITTIRSGIIE